MSLSWLRICGVAPGAFNLAPGMGGIGICLRDIRIQCPTAFEIEVSRRYQQTVQGYWSALRRRTNYGPGARWSPLLPPKRFRHVGGWLVVRGWSCRDAAIGSRVGQVRSRLVGVANWGMVSG